MMGRARSDTSPARRRSAPRLSRHPPPRPAARLVPLPRPQRPRRDTCPSWSGAVAGWGSSRLSRHPGRGRAGGRRLPARLRHAGDPAPGRDAGADRGGGDPRLRADDACRQLAGRRAPGERADRSRRQRRASRPSTRRSRSATGSSPSTATAPASSPGASPCSATRPRLNPPPTSASPTPSSPGSTGAGDRRDQAGFGPTPEAGDEAGAARRLRRDRPRTRA